MHENESCAEAIQTICSNFLPMSIIKALHMEDINEPLIHALLQADSLDESRNLTSTLVMLYYGAGSAALLASVGLKSDKELISRGSASKPLGRLLQNIIQCESEAWLSLISDLIRLLELGDLATEDQLPHVSLSDIPLQFVGTLKFVSSVVDVVESLCADPSPSFLSIAVSIVETLRQMAQDAPPKPETTSLPAYEQFDPQTPKKKTSAPAPIVNKPSTSLSPQSSAKSSQSASFGFSSISAKSPDTARAMSPGLQHVASGVSLSSECPAEEPADFPIRFLLELLVDKSICPFLASSSSSHRPGLLLCAKILRQASRGTFFRANEEYTHYINGEILPGLSARIRAAFASLLSLPLTRCRNITPTIGIDKLCIAERSLARSLVSSNVLSLL